MELQRAADYGEMSRRAAEIVCGLVTDKPDAVLGLVTGGTVEGMYEIIAGTYEAGAVDFSRVTTVNTDEYYPIDATHDQSYRYFMEQRFFRRTNVDTSRSIFLNGAAEDAEAECRRFDAAVEAAGPMDLLVLGIGGNGHIAFNEPDAGGFTPETHKVALLEETVAANARFFDSPGAVPRHALTMGVGGIFSAKRILLMASGKGKSKALAQAFTGKVTPLVPASILQLHPRVTLLGDVDALSDLA